MNDDQRPAQPSNPASRTASGRIFDVMRPGQTPAHPSSRPTIVGHIPQVKNSMVGGSSSLFAANPATEDHPLMDGRKQVQVAPDPVAVPAVPVALPELEVPAPAMKPIAEASPEPQPEAEPVQQLDSTPMPHLESEISTEPDTSPVPTILPVVQSTVLPYPTSDPAESEPVAYPQPEKMLEHYDSWPPNQPNRPAAGLSPELLAKAQQATKTPETHPLLGHDGVTVSHHMGRPKAMSIALTLLMLIVLGLIAGNFLLDAQVIKTDIRIPHTHLLKKQ